MAEKYVAHNITLTNRELAESLSFPVAAALLKCPICNYVDVTNSLKLRDPKVACPKCNAQSGEWRSFPEISGIKLLKMVAYFYKNACIRGDKSQEELVNRLQNAVGQRYPPQLAINTAKKIQNLYQKLGGGQAEYKRALEIIQKRLSLQSSEEAQKVSVPLFKYSETFEEHKVVVILICVLLEKLFDDLLVSIHTCEGMKRSKAYEKVHDLRSFGALCEAFKGAT